MTVTNRYVAPIVVGEQPGGLLQIARQLPAGTDWRGGVTFTPVVADIGRWGCVTDGTEKPIDAQADAVRFDPFMLFTGATCSGAPDENELRLIARAGMVRGKSGEIAHELVTSLFGNPDLTTTATDLTPATPQGIKNSLSGLLSAIRDCGRGEVILHADLAALPYLLDIGLVWTGTKYMYGAIEVSVDDYPFRDGDDADLGDANPSYTPLYMTRPVEVETAPVVDEFNIETRINRGTVVVEELAVLRFDPACVFSIIADLGQS